MERKIKIQESEHCCWLVQKNRNGTRSLFIPLNLCAILESYRTLQASNLKRLRLEIPAEERFVFCRLDGRTIHPSTFSSLYAKVRRSLNINTTFHMLRHDFACRMKKSRRFGFKDIQMQLGHSTIRTTLDIYTHIDDSDRIEVSNWLEGELDQMLDSKK